MSWRRRSFQCVTTANVGTPSSRNPCQSSPSTHDSIHPFRLILPMVCLYNRQATKTTTRRKRGDPQTLLLETMNVVLGVLCGGWAWIPPIKNSPGIKKLNYHYPADIIIIHSSSSPCLTFASSLWSCLVKGAPNLFMADRWFPVPSSPLPPRWLSDLAILPTAAAVIQSPRAKAGVQSGRWWCSWWGSVTINLFAFRVMNWIEPGGMRGATARREW